MKTKSRLLKILMAILILFVLISMFNKSYGLISLAGVAGIAVILIVAPQLLMVALGLAGQGIIQAIAGEVVNGVPVTIKNIIFNEVPITTASFFSGTGGLLGTGETLGSSPISGIFDNITQIYYIIRNFSIAALLFVLLYIGIRMTISTVASEEAKYKKMLINWGVSLITIFVLHYIMIITFFFNNKIVAVLNEFANDVSFGSSAALAGLGVIPIVGLDEAIVFLMCIGIELTFLLMYIKRVITLGFLIVIAPLITITYSIDKVGDGKSQALNAWLKEFIFTVIIQPFHCIIYIVIVQTVLEGVQAWSGWGEASVAPAILYVLMLKFLKEAEGIVKKIFNVQSDSMPGASNMGAMALGLMTSFGGKGKKGGKGGNSHTEDKMPKLTKEKNGGTEKEKKGKKPETANEKQGSKEKKWHPKLSQEQMDELKAEGIEPGDQEYEQYLKNHGIDPNQKAEKETKGENSTTSLSSEEKAAKKMKKRKSDNENKIGFLGGVKIGAKTAAKIGAGGAALGIGLGMADEKAALGAALLAYSQTENIEQALKEHNDNVQLEKNEEAYKEKYREFIENYRQSDPSRANLTDEQILSQTNKLFDLYDSNTLDENIISDAEKELLGYYQDMLDSYEIVGASDSSEMIKRLNKRVMFENKERQ